MRDEKSGKESKQVNFRIDPDSAEAFRLFCTTHGMNQAQGFDHLIQVLELNNAKAATPGRAVEIENFERLLKEILSAYIGSIELSSNGIIIHRHWQQGKRKILIILPASLIAQWIDELREKVETIAGEKNNQDAALTALKEEQVRTKEQAQHATSQLESAKKATADQEEINRILQEQNQQLQEKASRYDSLKKSDDANKEENTKLQLRIRELEQMLSHETALRTDLENTSKQASGRIRELESQQIECRIQISDLQRQLADKDSDIENRLKQAKMQADLEQERAVIAKERELQDELRKMDRDNVKLRTELEQTKAALEQEMKKK